MLHISGEGGGGLLKSLKYLASFLCRVYDYKACFYSCNGNFGLLLTFNQGIKNKFISAKISR